MVCGLPACETETGVRGDPHDTLTKISGIPLLHEPPGQYCQHSTVNMASAKQGHVGPDLRSIMRGSVLARHLAAVTAVSAVRFVPQEALQTIDTGDDTGGDPSAGRLTVVARHFRSQRLVDTVAIISSRVYLDVRHPR